MFGIVCKVSVSGIYGSLPSMEELNFTHLTLVTVHFFQFKHVKIVHIKWLFVAQLVHVFHAPAVSQYSWILGNRDALIRCVVVQFL